MLCYPNSNELNYLNIDANGMNIADIWLSHNKEINKNKKTEKRK